MSGDMELVQLLVCPSCRTPLVEETDGILRCPDEGTTYTREAGVWRLLDDSRGSDATRFLAHYQAVRRREGWGADDDGYYRALPFEDRTGRHPAIWYIRATTYRVFARKVMQPIETVRGRQRILDLGAGNSWLSYRLARRGHEVAAVDLNDDPQDGLGAHVHYDREAPFAVIQASFDQLPWPDEVIDLAIYNGSLHYSTDYCATLREALRVLAPGGRVVILDSPFYRHRKSGEAMVREREDVFRDDCGGDTGGMGNEGFLTLARLDGLEQDLGISWRVLHPYYGLRWALQPVKNWIMGRREPARFCVVIGSSSSGEASR